MDWREITFSLVLTPQLTVKVVLSVICLVTLTVRVTLRTLPGLMVVTSPLHVMETAAKGSVIRIGAGDGVTKIGVSGTTSVGVGGLDPDLVKEHVWVGGGVF